MFISYISWLTLGVTHFSKMSLLLLVGKWYRKTTVLGLKILIATGYLVIFSVFFQWTWLGNTRIYLYLTSYIMYYIPTLLHMFLITYTQFIYYMCVFIYVYILNTLWVNNDIPSSNSKNFYLTYIFPLYPLFFPYQEPWFSRSQGMIQLEYSIITHLIYSCCMQNNLKIAILILPIIWLLNTLKIFV